MRLFITLFPALFLFSNAQSQKTPPVGKGVISGKVIDAVSKNPIEYATITVYPIGSTKPINGIISNAKGNFKVEDLRTGLYSVSIDFIGYSSTKIDSVAITADKLTISTGIIKLSNKTGVLQNVTVTSNQSLIENKIDKMVYNVDKDITAQGGVATDVLKKVPQVFVDIDGNVELLGSSSIRFLINGKPSAIFGSSVSEALQSIPSSQIQSIEVITSPGAKFSLQGSGGIINIILKKSIIRGMNAAINLSAGTRLENGSVNLNYRHNNFGMNAYFSGNAQVRSTTINRSNRVSDDTAQHTKTNLLQNGNSSFIRNGYHTGLGFDWTITKKDNLSGTLGLHHFLNSDNGITYQETIVKDDVDIPLSDTTSVRAYENHSATNSVDWNVSYRKTFKKEDQELDISYNNSNQRNTTFYTQDQRYLSSSSIFSGYNSNNPGKNTESELAIDYTHPFTEKFIVEAGLKNEGLKINSAADVYSFNKSVNAFLVDPNQSYSLKYKRDVYAVYLSASFPVGKFLDIKAGGRYEHTVTNAQYGNVQKSPIPSYSKFGPSLVLSHKLTKNQFIKLSYTYRIERPEYRELNPFVNLSDPHNISTGNPLLRPEIGNNLELAYNHSFEKGSNINVAIIYRRNSDDITNFTVYYPSYKVGDSILNDVSVSTRMNINSEQRTGGNVSGSLVVSDKFTLRSNLFLFDQRVTDNANGGVVRSSFGYRTNINGTWLVNKDLAFEFFGNFRSKETTIQGSQTSFISYNMAMRKWFLNKKVSIGLTANNPFSKYVSQTRELAGPNFQQVSVRQIPFRSFGINFTWKFGKLEFKKSKEDDPNSQSSPLQ